MCSRKYLFSVGCLVVSASTLILICRLSESFPLHRWTGLRASQGELSSHAYSESSPADGHKLPPRTGSSSSISLPITLEENVGQADPRVEFIARGKGITALLTGDGIEFAANGRREKGSAESIKLRVVELQGSSHRVERTTNKIEWRGSQRLRSESNYFLGNDPRHWHTHVPNFERAESTDVVPGIGLVLYGSEDKIEYDLHVSPGANLNRVRLAINGASSMRVNSRGDLLLGLSGKEIIMGKPAIYSLADSGQRAARISIDGGYVLERDGMVSFRVGPHDPRSMLVIDPSLSITYSTFLGGTGDDSARSIALDNTGKLLVAGTTTSAATFIAGAGSKVGPGGAADFFIAKIDPTMAGANSLIYLTFLGGSGDESGGQLAVDGAGNAAIMGTTNSPDFPVTDGSKRTSGANNLVVAEIAPTGASLVFSTLFGGNGAVATRNPGGIAIDKSSNVFVSSDTTSTDLTTTPNAWRAAYGGGVSDGFLAVFRPGASPHLNYCTYLGINAFVGIGGVAVDAGGNAYVAGFTSNPGASFSAVNAFQSSFGGDPYDAFIMKIRPSGTGAADLAYGTFLGGSDLDQALAVTVGTAMPATAYVTGTTQSKNFPMNGAKVGPQSSLKGTANAFLAAVAQDVNGMTSLAYSTYLGGSQTDAGSSVAFAAPNAVYVSGTMTSFDYVWLNNLQPFSGATDAFLAKLDTTASGSASLIYASPLNGTAPPGVAAISEGNSIVSDGAGHVFIAGSTTAGDFPHAGTQGNGLQQVCASCQQTPPLADAFVVAIQEGTASLPSVSFVPGRINFGSQTLGNQNIPPFLAGILNTGTIPLNVSTLTISGSNAADFALTTVAACMTAPIQPGAPPCQFEVTFTPRSVGPEQAFLVFSDDAPGTTQSLEMDAIGQGPLAVLTPTTVNFGSQPAGTVSKGISVTLTNVGNQPLTITSQQLTGPDAAQFKKVNFTCAANAVVQPQSSCDFGVEFAPQGTGPYQAGLQVVDDSGNLQGTQQLVPLSGLGTTPAPVAALLPSQLSFGSQAIGTASASQTLSLTNTGSTALTINSIALTGADASNFLIGPPANGSCPTTGGTLAIGASCTLALQFAPLSGGNKSAKVTFADNAPGSPQAVPLAGVALAPAIQISPASLNFGIQTLGTSSAPLAVTLTNTGSGPLGVGVLSVIGADPGDFKLLGNCPPSLGNGQSCALTVTFLPRAAGTRTASVLIQDNAPGNPQSIPLAGSGAVAGVGLSPSSILNFDPQSVGTSSNAVPVVVTNTGTGQLMITSITIAGTNAADFSQTNNCASAIAPGLTCTVQLIFTPACIIGPTVRTATLLLADNAPGASQSLPLSGTASGDFCIAPAPGGSMSATVVQGSKATYNLEILPLNGFSGSVTLTCTGQPAEAACILPSAPISVIASSAQVFQVEVTTTAPSTLVRSPDFYGSPSVPLARTAAIHVPLVFAAMLALVLTLRRQMHSNCNCLDPRGDCGIQVRARLIALVLLLTCGLNCCGGSGIAAPSNPGTPPSSSQLILKATCSSTNSSTTVAMYLVVQPGQ
jgi:hypothetical protein